jgi:hypothetical protein
MGSVLVQWALRRLPKAVKLRSSRTCPCSPVSRCGEPRWSESRYLVSLESPEVGLISATTLPPTLHEEDVLGCGARRGRRGRRW